MNRLTSEHLEGLKETLSNRYSYDVLGNCTSSTDIYGNKTLHEYDSNCRLIKTLNPETYGEKRQTQHYARNAQGFVTSLTDGNGHASIMEYNINGKLISKTYPDGITERNVYTLWGEIAESISRDGTRICYSYDPLGREIKKEWFDSKGISLKSTSKTYNAFDLLSETDGNGIATKYAYDDAGRIIVQRTKKKRTEYSYDTLGRKTTTTKQLGKDKTISHVEVFDKLNRVIEWK
jgi:YD repeat-containing protein